jgi:hypothetical protein
VINQARHLLAEFSFHRLLHLRTFAARCVPPGPFGLAYRSRGALVFLSHPSAFSSHSTVSNRIFSQAGCFS